MTQRPSTNPRIGLRFLSWPTALFGIILIKAVLSLAVKPGSFLFSYSGISYFLLLLLATGFAVRNATQNIMGNRLFWVFFAIALGLWALDQWIFLYYELGLQIEVPDNSIADPVLFIHIVPFIAALAVFPHRNAADRKLYPAILNSVLLLFFWSFLYIYAVFPYQYLFSNATNYALRFDSLYLLENWALVLTVGILSLRVHGPWRAIYLHFLGASALYALSSAVANFAIDSGGYVNGRLYGLGLIASACWFVWIPLRARQVTETEAKATRNEPPQKSQASAWAMFVIVMISIPIAWELLRRDEATGVRTFRLLAAIIAIVGLSSTVYIKEHLAKGKLASDLGLANDRFRLAVEASKSVGWEWDLKTGQDAWFGDLQTMFGIPSDSFVGRTEDFYRYVHPEDRQAVAKAVAEARQNRKPYASEFRVVRIDGTERWVSARGQFYYGAKGDPERMVGMAADITDRKLAEVALSSVTRRVVEAEERERKRIAVDLHEDIGQRLALLANELEQLKTDTPNQSAEVRSRVNEVWKQTLEVLTDVKTSAHELHSPRLEYLGIATVMKCFCDEFGDRKKVAIAFSSHDVPSFVAPDISVCLFRVLQEALYNAVKHSGVQQFTVQLTGTSTEVHLTVSDSGSGFDFESARKGDGLGLTRMTERLKLVQGTFSIDSQPTKGTIIRVTAPFKTVNDS